MKTTNYFLNLNELVENKVVLKSKPQVMQIFISDKCNLNCIMCCNKEGNTNNIPQELDYKTIENLILTNPQLLVIEWLGGEPTLHPKFEQLLDLAHNQNIKQILVTNGTLLTKAVIKKLIDYNVDVTISMDAPIKSVYEKIRMGADFNRLKENLVLFVEEKKKRNHNFNLLTVNYVVLKENYKYILEMVDFIKNIGIKNVFFENDITSGIHNISYLSEEEYNRFQNDLSCIKSKENKEIDILIDECFFNRKAEPIQNFSINKDDKNKCLIPWLCCCIHSNGDVTNSMFCSLVLGNIYKNNLADVLNSEKNIELRKQILKDNTKLKNICSLCEKLHPITRMYRALDRATKILFRN